MSGLINWKREYGTKFLIAVYSFTAIICFLLGFFPGLGLMLLMGTTFLLAIVAIADMIVGFIRSMRRS